MVYRIKSRLLAYIFFSFYQNCMLFVRKYQGRHFIWHDANTVNVSINVANSMEAQFQEPML